MFSQRKTEVSYGNTIPRNFDVIFGMLRKTFRIEELQCCSDVEVLVCEAVENVQVLEAEKKIGVDWPRPNRFRKNFFKESMFKSKNRRGQV